MDWIYKCPFLIILFIYSIFLLNGRGVRFLAGFTTMSKEEYNTYNHKAAARFMGKIFMIASLGLTLLILGDAINNSYIHTGGLGVFLGSLIFAIIYANTNNRFKLK